MAVLYALLNAVMISGSNIVGGLAVRRLPLPIVVAIAGPASIVVAIMLAPLVGGTPTVASFWIGFAAGVFGGAGLPVAYLAYSIGPVGIAGAVLAVSSTALLTFFGVLGGAALTPLRAIGLVLCIMAILLVTYRPPVDGERVSPRGPLLAMLAAVIFTGFVVTINTVPASEGMWPLVGARMGVTLVAVVMLTYFLVRAGRRATAPSLRRTHLLIPVAAGTFDTLGNLFLLLALQAGDLVLLALFAPAAPVFTAIIGRVFLNEFMTRWQIVGLVVASAALVLASL